MRRGRQLEIYRAKRYTSYGIATIATEMTQRAIISDIKRIFPCANYDPSSVSAIGHPATLASSVIDNTPKLETYR